MSILVKNIADLKKVSETHLHKTQVRQALRQTLQLDDCGQREPNTGTGGAAYGFTAAWLLKALTEPADTDSSGRLFQSEIVLF